MKVWKHLHDLENEMEKQEKVWTESLMVRGQEKVKEKLMENKAGDYGMVEIWKEEHSGGEGEVKEKSQY